MIGEARPRLGLVPPQDAPTPPRYQVLRGVKDGWPHIELVDNQTGARIAYPVPEALAMAGTVAIEGAKILDQLRGATPPEKPQAPKPTILNMDGMPV